MIRAPPLAVSVIGSPAIGTVSRPDQPAQEDAGADEDHVGHDRRPVGIPELLGRPLDIELGADEVQHVAAVDVGVAGERHRLPDPHDLAQEDAAGGSRGSPALMALS
jgi:hypothetical protein